MMMSRAEEQQACNVAAGAVGGASATEMENFESYCISLGVGPLWYS